MLYFTHLCAVVIFPIGNMILLLLHDICIIFTFLQTWGATPRTRHINLSSSLPVSWDLISVIQIMAVMTAEKIAIQVAPSQLKSCHNPRLSKPVGWSSQTEGSIRSVRGTLADPREAGDGVQFRINIRLFLKVWESNPFFQNRHDYNDQPCADQGSRRSHRSRPRLQSAFWATEE